MVEPLFKNFPLCEVPELITSTNGAALVYTKVAAYFLLLILKRWRLDALFNVTQVLEIILNNQQFLSGRY